MQLPSKWQYLGATDLSLHCTWQLQHMPAAVATLLVLPSLQMLDTAVEPIVLGGPRLRACKLLRSLQLLY